MSRTLSLILLVFTLLLAACGTDVNTGTGVPGGENTVAPSSPDPTKNLIPSPAAGNTEIIPVTGDINPGRLSHLLDLAVYNQAGEQIGEVQDLVLNLDTSLISYVVVATGGFMDIAEKEVAVPWHALDVQADTRSAASPGFVFVLLVEQEIFNNAPEVNMASEIPAIGAPIGDWDHQIRSYWNLDASGVSTGPTAGSDLVVPSEGTVQGIPLKGIILATDALGFDFKLQGQEQLDVSIDDMIIDIASGEILYVVIHTNFDNAREEWIPIPRALLNWDPNGRVFFLNNVDLVTLQEAPFYSDGIYPNTTVPGWDDIYVFFWSQHGLNQNR